MNVTHKQRKIMLECLKENPEILRGRISKKTESRREMQNMWTKVAVKLNGSGEGPTKSRDAWVKCWSDWKASVLKKETMRRSYARGTGGGSPKKINFTDIEEELLTLLTPEAAGLSNIPEGGFSSTSTSSNENIPKDELANSHHEKQSILVARDPVAQTGLSPNERHDLQYSDILEYILNENADEPNSERTNSKISASPVTPVSHRYGVSKDSASNLQRERCATFSQRTNIFKDVTKRTKAKQPQSSKKTNMTLTDVSHDMLELQYQKVELKKKQVENSESLLHVQRGILEMLTNIHAVLRNHLHGSHENSPSHDEPLAEFADEVEEEQCEYWLDADLQE